tara:strand:+ start:7820 stop:9286 length:1467 start_codon:yes stop_codon:yes gene_type:complete
MSSHKKTAVIITKHELITNWLENVTMLVGEHCCFFVVPPLHPLKKIDLLFLKLNFKIFGDSKRIQFSSKFTIRNIANTDIEVATREYQTILNFTSLKVLNTEKNKYYQFLIAERPYNLREVIFNMLTSYKKIELIVQSDIKGVVLSSIRLDRFSVTKNTELILASFLVLLKANITGDFNRIKTRIKIKAASNTVLKNYFKYSFRFIKKVTYYFLYNEQWILGYSFNPSTIGVDLNNDIQIIPTKDRFWADPVVVEENGKYYVFIEELIYKNNIAHLSVFELKEDGTYTEPKIILKKPYHLSYPYVFKYNDTYYMIPETAHNNDIQLYEAVSFPFKWEFKQNLMENIKASDTTLLYKNNKWWLFTSIKQFEKGTYDNNLSIFYSDNLFTQAWKPHEKTPIIQDISTARQGGPFFNIDNYCYRVSQNCEYNYGYGFNLSKVENISEASFQEDIVYRFTPEGFKNIMGVHTYNHINGKLRVYDILTRTFKY